LAIQSCTRDGVCIKEEDTQVTLDVAWRWLHNVGGYENCVVGDKWNSKHCPDPETCAKQCAVEGLELDKGYKHTYGIVPVVDGVKLRYVPGSRIYVMDGEDAYKMFKLKNREFSIDVNVSSLPCGTNAAVYFVEMDRLGGKDGSKNAAGAKYGAGYCDAQCPRGSKFVDGVANMKDWSMKEAKTPSGHTTQVGPEGSLGACCAEMDIFEANKDAAAYTAHPCSTEGYTVCEGDKECGNKQTGDAGVCDKDGCGFNPYRLGEHNFYGPGPEYTIDTTKQVTIVTQFLTEDGSDSGDLWKIRRFWVQDGKVLQNSMATLVSRDNALTDELCQASVQSFNASEDTFTDHGGLRAMGQALDRGMVLALSVWDDGLSRMLWLDGEKQSPHENETMPGVQRGPCSFESGVAKTLERENKEASVTFTNIKYGELGSTFSGELATTTTPPTSSTKTQTPATTSTTSTVAPVASMAATTTAEENRETDAEELEEATSTRPPRHHRMHPPKADENRETDAEERDEDEATTTAAATLTSSGPTTTPAPAEPEEERKAEHEEEAATTSTTVPTSDRVIAPAYISFDCDLGVQECEFGWSALKKAWCKKHHKTSCLGVATAEPASPAVTKEDSTSSTPASTSSTKLRPVSPTTTTVPTASQAKTCKAYGCVPYAPQNACQCNDLCKKFDDCCEDYAGACATSGHTTPTTAEPVVLGTSSHVPSGNATEDLCCMASRSAQDICSTCYSQSWSHADNWCGQSKDKCEGCGKTWCLGVQKRYTQAFMRKYEGLPRAMGSASALDRPLATSAILGGVAALATGGFLLLARPCARTRTPGPYGQLTDGDGRNTALVRNLE
jgi:cellulose 1,4-beta-cellobiosidase